MQGTQKKISIVDLLVLRHLVCLDMFIILRFRVVVPTHEFSTQLPGRLSADIGDAKFVCIDPRKSFATEGWRTCNARTEATGQDKTLRGLLTVKEVVEEGDCRGDYEVDLFVLPSLARRHPHAELSRLHDEGERAVLRARVGVRENGAGGCIVYHSDGTLLGAAATKKRELTPRRVCAAQYVVHLSV